MLSVLVINLQSRVDRWDTIRSHLRDLPLRYYRVDAVDGSQRETPLAVTAGEEGCWLSHVKAYQMFLELETQYCLILEDDADVSGLSPRTISQIAEGPTSLRESMKSNQIDLLQLGFVSYFYQGVSGRAIALRNRLEEGRLRRPKLKTSFGNVVLDDFRAGTHAYLVSQRAAGLLSTANQPPFFGADDFLYFLSRTRFQNPSRRSLKIGRLSKSLIGQRSRMHGRQAVDSNIEVI